MSQLTPLKIARYDAPHQFEPLLPAGLALEPLLERASDLTRAAASLGSAAMPGARRPLASSWLTWAVPDVKAASASGGRNRLKYSGSS